MRFITPRIFYLLVVFFFFIGRETMAQTFWMQNAGGATIDEGMDVGVDGAGNTYVTGYFTSAAAFGSTTLSSSGIDDIFLAKLGPNGLFTWAVKAGGANSDRALSIKTDNSGNSYITGYFYGSATFGSFTINSAGAQDVFIAKYNSSGTCLWVKSAGGTGADIGNGIAVDPSGNVVVTGEFAGTASFGSTSLTSMAGSTDVFTTRLDASGNFLWTKQGSAPLTDRGIDVDCDASGNIYITGQFSDTITFDVTHTNNMLNAVFVVKYNSSGAEQWFRKIGGGAMNTGNSIACDNAGGIYLAGDFQGTITFYPSNTTLSSTYTNRIYLAKFDSSGGLTWQIAESSDSPLTVKSVATNGTNCFITGNFKCTFNTYSAHYGTGIFNSSGFWDIYEGKYSSSGSWIMARQFGGKKDQFCNGISIDGNGNPHLAGSYVKDIITPTSNAFYGYNNYSGYNMQPATNLAPQGNYCSDPYYQSYAIAPSAGNADIFVGNPVDPNRSPYDYYYRSGSGCSTPFVETCINLYTGLDFICGGDTIGFCQQGALYASTNTSDTGWHTSIGPDFTFLWSPTNQTNQYIIVSSSGYYSVVMTSADGCYTSEDTIYALIHPSPPTPTISDNVVINSNATSPQAIVICADSVLLVGGNYGNGSVYWQGPEFYPNAVYNDSVYVDSSGAYVFVVTDSNGCSISNHVDVTLDHPLIPIDPAMLCLEDTDFNDTVTTCENVMVTLFPYDTLSNPNGNFYCIDELTQVLWTITPSSGATIFPTSDCNTNMAITFATIHTTGWYTITETIIRTSACGNDTTIGTHSYYFIVNPAPTPGSLTLTITPNVFLCPGDSALLVVSGGSSYIWSNGSQNDSIVVYAPGNYFVNGFDTITNSYGCSAMSSAIVQTTVSYTPQPIILMNPADGVICPGDSVTLTASGNGIFSWQGPNGPIPGNGNTIYVNSPGTYYCVETTPDSCQLLSNSVTVQQYNTPSIQASPSGILCPGDTIIISLTASSTSAVSWNPPLSGSGLTQIITTPGTYSCTVNACNLGTTVSITIVPTSVSAVITPLTTTTVCVGDSILLGANTGMTNYLWQPGNNTSQSMYVFSDGLYYLTTSDSGGCVARDSFQVNFTPNLLTMPLSQDTTVCAGTPVILTASGAPTLTWYDSPGGNVLATGPVFTISGLQSQTTYYVLTDDSVCKSQPEAVTVYTEECTPQIPNVFTPDGDGVNDVFSIYEPHATGMHVWIYDRWGVLVYEWDGLAGYWDGTYEKNGQPVTDGVYYYIANVSDLNYIWQSESGFIQLIRGGRK